MLHLFNKIYLELDDKIELNYDRVVIGTCGVPLADRVADVTNGQLLSYSTTYPDNFVNFITTIKSFTDTSNKKLIIYADKTNYIKIFVEWIKTILPNLDLSSFNKLKDLTVYKERVINNTQLQTVGSLNMTQLWEGLCDLTDTFNNTTISDEQRSSIKSLNLNYSYEYLLSDYFSGSTNYTSSLNTTVHKFLIRWFKEAFTDNREMVLMNLLNKTFQTGLSFTESDINLTSSNPISGVSSLQYYADETIWEQKDTISSGVYGICNLEGINQTQVDGLRTLIKKVYADVEGMEINRTMFSAFDYLEYAVKDSISNTEMNTILDFVVANPFDTCLIPKFDFQNVNFVLIQHIFNLKRDNSTEALTKFRLL